MFLQVCVDREEFTPEEHTAQIPAENTEGDGQRGSQERTGYLETCGSSRCGRISAAPPGRKDSLGAAPLGHRIPTEHMVDFSTADTGPSDSLLVPFPSRLFCHPT